MKMAKKNNIKILHDDAGKNVVRSGLEQMRTYKRRTVVWPAVLYVNEFEFKCMLYDISFGGVRLKLDLPLATGTHVQIKIKDLDGADALVSWHADEFVGLKFTGSPEDIEHLLGDYAQNLS